MPEISRRDIFSVVFLVLAAAIAIGAFLTSEKLADKVDQLAARQSELTTQNEDLVLAQAALESANAALAEDNSLLSSQRDDLQKQVESGNYEISLANKSQADLLRALVGEGEFRRWTGDPECEEEDSESALCLFDREYGELLNLRQQALLQRSVAQSTADFGELSQIYSAINEKNNEMLEREIWQNGRANYVGSYRAFAREGLAYTSFKLGDIENAERLISRALRAARASATANLTHLKILCRKRAAPETVRRALQTARDSLDQRISRLDNATSLRIARINRAHLEQDPEMLAECAYADIFES